MEEEVPGSDEPMEHRTDREESSLLHRLREGTSTGSVMGRLFPVAKHKRCFCFITLGFIPSFWIFTFILAPSVLDECSGIKNRTLCEWVMEQRLAAPIGMHKPGPGPQNHFFANRTELLEAMKPHEGQKNAWSLYNQRHPESKDWPVKKILFWTEFWDRSDFYFGFGREPFFHDNCDVTACETTADKSEYDSSDAVIIHINNLTVPSPSLPVYRLPHHKWVFYNGEPPYLTRVPLEPFDNLFNVTLSYRLDSDVRNPYGSYSPLTSAERENVPSIDYARGKTKVAAWYVSNCETRNKRERYAAVLRRYMPVDVYGLCGTLSCPKEEYIRCYEMLRQDYKFYLAFENSLCVDYVTEKAWAALWYDVVPVVMGGSDYRKHLPPNSFIDVKDFSSPQELAKYLLMLDQNSEKYNEYFAWRRHYKLIFPYLKTWCDLCEYLHTEERRVKSYPSLSSWYSEQTNCYRPEDYYEQFANIYIT